MRIVPPSPSLTRSRSLSGETDGKDPGAVALGRKGGLKGGPARKAALTPEQRKAAAEKATAARWRKND
jgi:hypothetical protein